MRLREVVPYPQYGTGQLHARAPTLVPGPPGGVAEGSIGGGGCENLGGLAANGRGVARVGGMRRRPPGGRGCPPGGRPFSRVVRRRPTLPRGPPRSTIGAVGLSFRVRNGYRAFPRRYDRRNTMEIQTYAPTPHTPAPASGGFGVGPVASREPHSGRRAR